MKELGRIIQLNKKEQEGYSTCTNEDAGLPFVPKRLYWIYDVPRGESRGGHAHKRLKQIIIAAKGSFTVHLDNGHEKKDYFLNRPDQGLLLDTEIWRTIDNFSEGAVCLVLASRLYEPEDYLYEYDNFIEYIQQRKSGTKINHSK